MSIWAGPLRRDWRGAVFPLSLVAFWSFVSWRGWFDTRLIVPPWTIPITAWHFIATGHFFAGVLASLYRDIIGFVLGGAAGVVLGVVMGASRWTGRFIGPTFHVLRQISLFAWLPLISSWLGTGDGAKIVLIALSAFYPAALGAFEGVRQVPHNWLELARVYEFSFSQVASRLILPAAARQIATGLHLALIYAWLATVGGEFLLGRNGIGVGDAVMRGRSTVDIALMIFGMLVIGLIGAVGNRLAALVESRVIHWRADAR